MAHLLVTTKWHIPGRKAKKNNSTGFQKIFHPANQFYLVMNMFDYIFQYNDIEQPVKIFFYIYLINIFQYKLNPASRNIIWQIFFCIFNSWSIQFHSHSLTTFIDKC